MPRRTVAQYHRGFIVAEDAAIKAKLSGITVPNPEKPSGEEEAKVGYRLPVNVAERKYPYISVDLVDVRFASERAHSAQMMVTDYWPSEYATFQAYADAKGITFDPDVQQAEAIQFLPYDLTYQIQTFTRHAQQDRALMGKLLGTAFLPDRWGYLDVPEDGSCRWLDRTDMRQADFIEGNPENGERVFSRVITVVVSAHLPPELPFVYLQVAEVLGTVHDIADPTVSESWTHVATP